MANSIVQVNVSVNVAPTHSTLQKTGALISQGGTILSPGNYSLLTQLSDLTALLPSPASISNLVWAPGTVTVTTTSNHGLPNGASLYIVIAGSTGATIPNGYNGTFLATVTGVNTFTYPLATNPGTPGPYGTWVTGSSVQLVQMATTFFAQGFATSVFVLELGANSVNAGVTTLSAYLTANPNSNYVSGAQGYFYSYLVPREWDGNASFIALMTSYQSPTARTYFFITTTLSTYMLYNALQKCAVLLVEAPVYGIWPANALTAITYSTGQVTATTTTAHGIVPGQWFTISGVLPVGYNGLFNAQAGTTGTTIVYNVNSALGAQTQLGTLQASLYSSAGIGSNEFSMAGPFQTTLQYTPSSVNRVTPFAFTFIYGVTAFPTQGNNALLTTLKTANVNIIGTGAEGGISNTIILWGKTLDGNDFTYWYSIDWVQINLDLDTANAVINGSNNPINPLYNSQPGIDVLQGVAASTMTRGITYGLVSGNVIQVALDGNVLNTNLDLGLYADTTVVNAVPFVTYAQENPSDYKLGRYAGLTVIYMPQAGFTNIVYNVNVTQLIAV